MSRNINRLSLVAALILGLAAGCTDRGTNVPDMSASGGEIGIISHDFFRELFLQIYRNASKAGPRVTFQIRMYVPEGSIPPIQGGQPKPVPLLMLLAPQDGNEWYFFNHGLKQLANQLIAEGSIQPMAIACISNDPTFGGYFYAGNSAPAGYYDYFIGGSLLDYLRLTEPYLTDSLPVGIGGVGMGGYGAFRAALMHKGAFSSISSTDGPLDFDGPAGNSGLMELFDDALMEQGLLDAQGWRTEFDSSTVWPLSRLFIGGAIAFSPHDTLIDTTGVYIVIDSNRGKYKIDIPPSQRYTLDDSTTLITDVVNPDQFDFDFHFPFDSTGAAYPLIWNMWLDNNLETILTDSIGALDSVMMWFATTPEFSFGNYREQTLSWIQTLRNNGFDSTQLQVKEYTGYPGNPATNDQYIYDLMRDMLIFHSKVFEQQR